MSPQLPWLEREGSPSARAANIHQLRFASHLELVIVRRNARESDPEQLCSPPRVPGAPRVGASLTCPLNQRRAGLSKNISDRYETGQTAKNVTTTSEFRSQPCACRTRSASVLSSTIETNGCSI